MIEDGNKKPADAATAQAQELLLIGTSMGGARPKTVVEDADGLWLAKFNTPHDRWNAARVEQAMLTLGRACGLTVADSRVTGIGGRDALLVKRHGPIANLEESSDCGGKPKILWYGQFFKLTSVECERKQ